MWEELINTIYSWSNALVEVLRSFVDVVKDIWSFVLSILQSIRYWLSTLTSSLWQIIDETIGNGALVSTVRTLDSLWDYIWWPAVVFLFSIILLVIGRIIIAFVFKVLRLNLDYHSMSSKTKRWNQEDTKQY